MKQLNATVQRALGVFGAVALGVGTSATAHAGEAPALKVFVRWSAFTPKVLAPSVSATSRVTASRDRLQGQLQNVVPGSWVGRTFQQVGWSVIAVPASQKATALAKLKTAFGANNVEAVHTRKLYRTPNDPDYSSQWWLDKIGAPAAWDKSTGSDSVIVAVVDTGVQRSHPDLTGNLWTNTADVMGDGIDNDGNGYIDDTYGYNAISPGNSPEDDDFEGHGTHVTGIVGARGNNANQVSGVNWNVKILPVKVFDGSGYTDDPTIVQGLDYLLALKAKNVNIRALNASWGGPDTSQVLQDAFGRLDTAGILSFVAAGNGDANLVGYSIDNRPDYPSNYTYNTIVSVASSNANDGRIGFSNYGARNVDIFAPGSDILSLALNGGTQYLDGTSMSTPIVTGAAALLWSIKSDLSATQMKALLMDSVTKPAALNGLCVSNGRLNLAQAVASLTPTTPTSTPTATATPRPTATPTATPRPTATATPRPTATATPRPTATATPRPTATATPRPTATATPRPTATATPRPTATATPRPTATPVPSGTFIMSGYTYYNVNGVRRPIAGVRVFMNNQVVATSNADGIYAVHNIAAGRYSVGARETGYSFEGVWMTFSGAGGIVRRDLLATAPSERYSINGTVKNSSGVVVKGVQILFNGQAVPVATTNDAGRFTLSDRTRGTYTISATIGGVLVSAKVTLPATTGALVPNADILLQPPVATPTATPRPTATPVPSGSFIVSGYTYYNENGNRRPVAGVSVLMNNQVVATSNADGIYAVHNIAAGKYSVGASATGYSFEDVLLTLSGAGSTVRQDIFSAMPSVRYSINGTVKNSSGVVVKGVQILLNSQLVPVATTNDAGRFTLSDRTRGTYTISATIGGVLVSTNVTLPTTTGALMPNADILLQPPATGSNGFA